MKELVNLFRNLLKHHPHSIVNTCLNLQISRRFLFLECEWWFYLVQSSVEVCGLPLQPYYLNNSKLWQHLSCLKMWFQFFNIYFSFRQNGLHCVVVCFKILNFIFETLLYQYTPNYLILPFILSWQKTNPFTFNCRKFSMHWDECNWSTHTHPHTPIQPFWLASP